MKILNKYSGARDTSIILFHRFSCLKFIMPEYKINAVISTLICLIITFPKSNLIAVSEHFLLSLKKYNNIILYLLMPHLLSKDKILFANNKMNEVDKGILLKHVDRMFNNILNKPNKILIALELYAGTCFADCYTGRGIKVLGVNAAYPLSRSLFSLSFSSLSLRL